MSGPSTLAAALVRALRAHGSRPAAVGAGAPSWATVADGARHLALGLHEAGLSGRRVAVDPTGAPHEVVGREVAVLAAGAVLTAPGTGELDARLTHTTMTVLGPDPTTSSRSEIERAGRRADRDRPAEAEELLATIEPSGPALAGVDHTVSQAEALWALRAVDRWLGPSLNAMAAELVVVVGGGPAGSELSLALLGRWWPASSGAALVGVDGSATATVASHRPTVAILGPDDWAELAGGVRRTADRSLGGPALLRRGRVVVAGESTTRRDRTGLVVARRWAGPRVRGGAGLDQLVAGVSLGPLAPGAARDLTVASVPVTPTWLEPGVLAPVAAGPVTRPQPATCWGRPLPGRSVEVAPGRTTVHGGDVGGGRDVSTRVRVDPRGRVRLPGVARAPWGEPVAGSRP
ncbi:hypothetical protein [Iamia sp.]|uniref:hypothetical protein n=1 Tax=Iamia sp. TaxID=2722710 RepID=UPI002B9800CF|nr:hypothetical protein [Iamia sp.]HXH59038.1 hypothetical protein [Iamia sp.]